MTFARIALVAAALLTAPASAWALGGGIGCADLPDYDRAQGVMQGIPSACDMSKERARQIIAEHDGPAAVGGAAAPAPRSHRHRRHRVHRTE